MSARNSISARTVIQFSFVGLDRAPDVMSYVFRLPGGGWGVSSEVFPGEIQRFDAKGAPVGAFGRAGQGPGELGGGILAISLGGEFWVFDHRNSRLSIFAQDLSFVGDRRFTMTPFFISPSNDGESVLVSGSALHGGLYYRLARISRDPRADVFGVPLGRHPLPQSQWLVKRVRAAETASGEVWAVAMSGGKIDVLRSNDLSVSARLQLPGEAMQRETPWVGDPDKPTPPTLAGIEADSDGLLWATFGVTDPAWKPGMDPHENFKKSVDTLVLVINPDKRKVVGKIQLDPFCRPVEQRLLSCVDELAQTISVIELEFKPGRRSDH